MSGSSSGLNWDWLKNLGGSSTPDLTSATFPNGLPTVPTMAAKGFNDVGSANASAIAGLNGGADKTGFGTNLGWNVGTGQLAASGLGSIANIWNAYQANDLAKKQFDFTKKTTDTNLTNQIQSYNTALSDRINARYGTEGKSPDEAAAYIQANKAVR
jgi:hypothetical protein